MLNAAPVRVVSLGQCAVEIECRVSEIDRHLDFLLQDTESRNSEVQARLVIEADAKGEYAVTRDNETRFHASTPGQLCTLLVGEIIFHLIENNSRELLVHAACLRRGPLGILLPGASGSGKSTICTWLLTRGFTYLTDELVCIDPDTYEISAFTRPLNLKHGGMQAVLERFGEDFGSGETLEGSVSHLVPHRLLSTTFTAGPVTVDVVVFPQYASTAKFTLEPLSSAKTALLLMQTFVNARNHAEHGFHDITAFARTVSGYRLTYSKFPQLEELERELDRLAQTRSPKDRTARGR